jgi:hypothetical protein
MDLLFPVLLFVLILGFHLPVSAQAASANAGSHIETRQDLLAHVTPAQAQQFSDADKAYGAHQFSEALARFKTLEKELPDDPLVRKLAASAALQSGDPAAALEQLRPIAQASPDDWQATALLTQAYAESGDKVNRDAGMAHMQDLHERSLTPTNLQQYTVERVSLGDNTLVIQTSLEPWGPYNVYDFGQVSDKAHTTFLRITVESADADQPLFAKQHPNEASQGLHQFSLDAYRETGLNSSGQRTQTHYTFQFFVGRPSYETVRDAFISVATGKASAISSRPNLVVP